jgi:hypothetical protein
MHLSNTALMHELDTEERKDLEAVEDFAGDIGNHCASYSIYLYRASFPQIPKWTKSEIC